MYKILVNFSNLEEVSSEFEYELCILLVFEYWFRQNIIILRIILSKWEVVQDAQGQNVSTENN
jgi:hypothetical protein